MENNNKPKEQNELKVNQGTDKELEGKLSDPRKDALETTQKTLEEETLMTINTVSNNLVESQRIAAETTIRLKQIEEGHKTINNHIKNEYDKQKQTLNKASDVVDKGLESNDLDIIKAGLETMSNVANHNPVADLKRSLETNIEKSFDDDDFMIEI